MYAVVCKNCIKPFFSLWFFTGQLSLKSRLRLYSLHLISKQSKSKVISERILSLPRQVDSSLPLFLFYPYRAKSDFAEKFLLAFINYSSFIVIQLKWTE